jgi:Tfp pilus assembly protein PilO
VSLTDRDRKLVMFVLPLVVVVAYWFLLLAPKRDEAASLADKVAEAQQARDQATQLASQRNAAKNKFAADYATIVRVGKAVPTSVDMPSLLVQLDAAAAGTGIEFDKIVAGKRTTAAGDSGAQGSSPGGSEGGGQAQSTPGQAAEAAEGAKDTANASSAQTDKASNEAGGSSPSTGGSPAAGEGAAAPATAPPGLDVVPLTMTFSGSFFDLADFMHRLKRFVRVSEDQVVVRGRLMQVESMKLTPRTGLELTAELTASVYLSPKAEGATAGASPQGPAVPSPAAQAGTKTTSTPPAAAATR